MLIFVLMAGFAFGLDTRPASAHAFLLRTDPADGSVLLSAPKQMRLWFSEPLEMDLTTITLLDGNNKTWKLQPYPNVEDPSVVVVDLPDLPPSAYRVSWRTVSDEDLHVISGFVVFGIGQSVIREQSTQTQNTAPPAEVAFHWIGLLSFAALFGALVIILFLLPSVQKKFQQDRNVIIALYPLRNKMILSAFWFCLIALITGLFMFWEKFVSIQGAGSIQYFDWKLITSLMSIGYIKRELASEVCLIAIAALMFYWLKANSTAKTLNAAIRNILLFSFAILWIFLQAMNSHASAFNDFSPTRVIAYALHLLGAGLWIGGQAALIFFVAPLLRTWNKHYVPAREIYVQFGAIAAIGVSILLLTGLYSGGQQVASLDALLLTPYGQALIFKSIFVILTCLIGLWHASLFHPRVARLLFGIIPPRTAWLIFGKANPTVTLRLQLLGGAAIFLLAAFLGSTAPARGPEFEAQAESVEILQPASLSGTADDLLVNFSIKPNQPGQNFILVGVFDTRRPSPAPIEQVTVKLLSPGKQDELQLDAAPSEKNGTYQISTSDIDLSGEWKASVIVHRTGLDDAVLELPWRVAPAAATVAHRPTLVSSRPLAPVLTTASLLLSVLLGVVWLAAVLKPDLFQRLDRRTNSSPQEIYR